MAAYRHCARKTGVPSLHAYFTVRAIRHTGDLIRFDPPRTGSLPRGGSLAIQRANNFQPWPPHGQKTVINHTRCPTSKGPTLLDRPDLRGTLYIEKIRPNIATIFCRRPSKSASIRAILYEPKRILRQELPWSAHGAAKASRSCACLLAYVDITSRNRPCAPRPNVFQGRS